MVGGEGSRGKFVRVTEAMAKVRSGHVSHDEEIVEVWEKDPSVQAFTDLMNRALDKPKEQALDVNVTLDHDLSKLKEAQRKNAEHAAARRK